MATHAGPPSESQWRVLLEMSRALAATHDVGSLLRHIAEATITLLGCERASVFLHDPTRHELWTLVALQSGEIRVPEDAGVVGSAFCENRTILVTSAAEDPRFNVEIDRRTGYTTHNLLAAPMVDMEGKPVGVVEALNRRAGTFSEADFPLIQLLADQAGVAVQRHYLHLQALAAAGMRHEMELARALQQSMLPRQMPVLPRMETAAWAATASLTGGDAYDLRPSSDGRLGILLADAAGHGLAPALIISQVGTLVRTFLEEHPHWAPDELLGKLNHRMSRDFQAGQFVTAFMAFAHGDGKLHWSSAGHGPVFLSASPSHVFEMLTPPQLPLGVSADWEADRSQTLDVSAGGILIAPSDGIFEARNAAGEQFGTDRLLAIAHACRNGPLTQLVDQVKRAVQSWQGGEVAADDQTLVVVRWLGEATPLADTP